MDLTEMSSEELRREQRRLESQLALIADQLKKVVNQERAAAIEEIYGIAHRLQLPLSAVLPDERAIKASPRNQPIKYRDPTNPHNVWIGKGARPSWFKRALAAGVSLDLLRAA